jgi:hypothetical protein
VRVIISTGEEVQIPPSAPFVSKIAEARQFLDKGVTRYKEIFASIFFGS